MASSAYPSTVNAQTTGTTHCYHCNTFPEDDDPPLRRCSRCRARAYCCRDCQKADWPQHKQECATLAAGGEVPNRRRTTMRVNYASFFGNSTRAASSASSSDNQEMGSSLFYLKTIRRSVNDVVILEPVAQFSKILDLMVELMEECGSNSGLNAFEDLRTQSNLGPGSLAFFNAPLYDGSVLRFEIIEEHNPEVARVIASTKTYTVRCACILLDNENNMLEGIEGRAQVKDMEVFRTFPSMSAAMQFASAKFRELQADGVDPVRRVLPMEGANPLMPHAFGILERAPAGAQRYDQIVEVRENEV